MDLTKSDRFCKQCENPMLKGVHTCEKRKRPRPVTNKALLKIIADQKQEIERLQRRLSDLSWQLNPDRMGQ